MADGQVDRMSWDDLKYMRDDDYDDDKMCPWSYLVKRLGPPDFCEDVNPEIEAGRIRAYWGAVRDHVDYHALEGYEHLHELKVRIRECIDLNVVFDQHPDEGVVQTYHITIDPYLMISGREHQLLPSDWIDEFEVKVHADPEENLLNYMNELPRVINRIQNKKCTYKDILIDRLRPSDSITYHRLTQQGAHNEH